jgi:ribosome-associated protein
MSAVPAVPVIADDEIEFSAVRSQGAGGQNVNKTATAVQLRFDIRASSLPEAIKERLLARRDQRVTKEGVIVIKAQEHRSQDRNREEALARLQSLVAAAAVVPRKRKPTKPSRAAKLKRLDSKSRQSRLKAVRRTRPGDSD